MENGKGAEAAPAGAFGAAANGAKAAAAGAVRGGNRRLVEQQILSEDSAAAGAAGFYGAGAANLGMQGGIYGLGNAGLRGVPGLMRGQFDESALSGLGGLNAMNGLGQNLQQQQVAQQRAMAAQQQAAAGAGVDFQGLMPTGFEGADAQAALLGNPAAMAGYPFQAGFNAAALGADAGGPAGAGLLNANATAMGGANMVAARNAQFGNAGAAGVGSLFDQGYNFARSEMALVRQHALNNNAALMGAGGQAGFNLAGLDRQSAGLRGLGPGVNPYANYGADPMMGAAGGVGADPYRRMGAADGAGAGPLSNIPAIRLAQHQSNLQRRMMANSLPERKDGSFPVVLYQESDEHKLTAYQCLLRKQLELFEADEDDVRCSTRQGRTAPIKLGQVGLRCRHCAGVQLAARTKGAAYYSQTVEGIYQIAQNMSKVHLCERCYRIPRDVRRQLIVLRSDCRRAIGGKEYWSENIRALGVYVDEGILRVKKPATKEDKEGEDKKEGESKEGESKDEEMKDGEGKKDGESADPPKSSEEDVKKEGEAEPMEEEKTEEKEDLVTKEESEEASDDKKDEKPAEEAKMDEDATPAAKTETGEAKKEEETTEEDKKDEVPPEEDKADDEAKPEEAKDEEKEDAPSMEVETAADDKKEEDAKEEAPTEAKEAAVDEKEEGEKADEEAKPEDGK